jgi:uncharacterized membrane protein
MGHSGQQGANQALVLLMLFLAFSMILGGMRGGKWALRLIFAPVHMILRHIENRIQAAVAVLVFTVLAGYGILAVVRRLFP